MRVGIGLAGAFGVFAAAFVLHIVGGATDQGWLFATAVILIYLTAAGFPVIALAIARTDASSAGGRVCVVLGGVMGSFLTAAAFWAANGRAFAWWEAPAGIASVAVVSGCLLMLGRRLLGASRGSAGERSSVAA